MLVELQRFLEITTDWYKEDGGKTRANMVMEPLLLNTEYVASVRRYCFHGDIEMCEVHMADRGHSFIVDKTYEEMRELLKA